MTGDISSKDLSVEHGTAMALGVRFHYVRCAPAAGTRADRPPIVLLHGFPETWWCWHKLLRPLAEASGLAVYAPDLKGFGGSDKPAPRLRPGGRDPRRRYDMNRLAAEMGALFEQLGLDRPVLVGHDWGGVIAHTFALRYPGRLSRLVVVNGGLVTPPPWRLWYAFFFQLPWLPEFALRSFTRAFIQGLPAVSRTPGTFSQEDLAVYSEALSRPGAASAGLGYYRAAARRLLAIRRRSQRRVLVPLLIVWSDADFALPLGLARKLRQDNPGSRLRILRECGHFAPEEKPLEVAQAIGGFLE